MNLDNLKALYGVSDDNKKQSEKIGADQGKPVARRLGDIQADSPRRKAETLPTNLDRQNHTKGR